MANLGESIINWIGLDWIGNNLWYKGLPAALREPYGKLRGCRPATGHSLVVSSQLYSSPQRRQVGLHLSVGGMGISQVEERGVFLVFRGLLFSPNVGESLVTQYQVPSVILTPDEGIR